MDDVSTPAMPSAEAIQSAQQMFPSTAEQAPDQGIFDVQRDRGYLMNLPQADIQHLASQGYLSPQAVQELDAAKLAQMQQSPGMEAAGQGISNVATGMLPQSPFPNTTQKATAPAAEDLHQTSQEAETLKAHQTAAEAGVQNAVEKTQLRQQARDIAAQEQALERVDQTTEQVRSDFAQSPNQMGLGQILFASLGAFSQGLTGSKSNMFFDIMEKNLEKEAKDKKYNDEQKIALRKVAVEEAMLKVHQMSAQSDNQLKKAQMAKLYAELGDNLNTLQAQQEFTARLKSGTGFGAAELATMDPAMANRMIQVKPGVYMPAASKDPDKLREALNTFDNATRDAKELRKMAGQFGNNSIAKIIDRQAKGRSEALLQGLVGALRLPYFGPGVLTDTEQSLARNMIGNPTNVFSLASANEARINTIIQKLNYAKKTALRNEGVNVPMSDNDKRMTAYKKAGVKMSDPELINAMIKKGEWNPDEE